MHQLTKLYVLYINHYLYDFIFEYVIVKNDLVLCTINSDQKKAKSRLLPYQNLLEFILVNDLCIIYAIKLISAYKLGMFL